MSEPNLTQNKGFWGRTCARLKQENDALKEQVKELKRNQCDCPHCGCTEMLCGHNGVGCEKDKM